MFLEKHYRDYGAQKTVEKINKDIKKNTDILTFLILKTKTLVTDTIKVHISVMMAVNLLKNFLLSSIRIT